MKITLKFLEPFRMLDWIKPDKRTPDNSIYQRGLTFAKWHKSKKNDKGRPYITGTLLRSAVIRAAENLLVLSRGKIGETGCCPGRFSTEKKKGKQFLRRRATLTWTTENNCDRESPCPFCELLGPGVFEKKKKNGDNKNPYMNFANLNPTSSPKYFDIREIAMKRVVNRVDYTSGKAHDFFRILEADHLFFPFFDGEITIGKDVSDEAVTLLKESLRFVDRLCGALCIIRFDDEMPKGKKADALPSETKNFKNAVEEAAKAISENLRKGGVPDRSQRDKGDQLQLLAAAVRELRRNKKMVSDLPMNHEGKEAHYLWDAKAEEPDGESIRDILRQMAENDAVKNKWREFCTTLSEELYKRAKETRGLEPARRIMGDAEFSQSPERRTDPHTIRITGTKETVICGTLIATTPFFFGMASDEKEKTQTDIMVVLDRQNHYRIPRSALRGILRRDLRYALGTGCNAEIAAPHICMCPVCRIMENITVMDTRSKEDVPPEVRQRIRINPFTGSVQEKALFNMEVGTEGVRFPFLLCYRGQGKLPDELKNVLKWWAEGKAFLGGAAATGKSIFQLTNIQAISCDLPDLSDDETVREKYLSNHGWRGDLRGFDLNAKHLQELGWQEEKLESDKQETSKPFLWEKVSVRITMGSPFLNGDPVRALTEDQSDIVSFMKYTQAGEKRVYAYKSESFRGVVRSAIGRRHKEKDKITEQVVPLIAMTHQDCPCLLCRLFGSEYETGKLRFEDLTFESEPAPKVFDHVAIDRFTGGAVDQKKFDDRSLIPLSDKDQLVLRGNFWFRKDLSPEEARQLGEALADIRLGFYPLGAKGSIGYGQIADMNIDGNGNAVAKQIAESMEKASPAPGESASVFEKPDPGLTVQFDEKAVYYPYYFLKPGKQVAREPIPVGHEEAFRKGRLTGKIRCRLTPLTPLIVPDTEDDNAFDMAGEERKKDEYHKSHRFFTLNGTPAIPGSEIRGMISSVYEAFTHSCFRIFNERYRLSWRMAADRKELDQFRPGRITDDGKGIEEMAEYRYPFYDKNCPDGNSRHRYFDKWDGTIHLTSGSLERIKEESPHIADKLNDLVNKPYKNQELFLSDVRDRIGEKPQNRDRERDRPKPKSDIPLILQHAEVVGNGVSQYNHPTPTDRMMLSLAEYNRTHRREKEQHTYKIVKPDAKLKDGAFFMFVATPLENPEGSKDRVFKKAETGYLKISGPNKIEKENAVYPEFADKKLPEKPEDVVHHRVYLREIFVANAPKRKDRDRLIPEFVWCDKEKGVTYTMSKRCERIFTKNGKSPIPITQSAADKFKILVDEYEANAEQQKTPEIFRTILPQNGRISPGDLLYFREENGKAVELIPVRISRKVDNRPIGKRLREDLRPCHGEWIEEEDLSKLDAFPDEKKLFTRHPKGLCPACRLFGTGSYKGRVRFGFAFLNGEATWLNPGNTPRDRKLTLPLLERPRPTWAIQYNDKENSSVPGRKFYVHHNGWDGIRKGKHPITGEEIKPEPNNRTVEPLNKGNTFTFEIFFENLEPYELGLLLRSIQLEKGLAHKLGMAKSMGFGSVDIDVENVSLRETSGGWENKSEDDVNGWISEGKKKVKEWIRKGEKEAEGWSGEEKGDNSDNTEALRKLLCFPKDQNPKVHYPPLKQDKENQMPGYEELKEAFKKKGSEEKGFTRKALLTTPWMPWLS